MPSTAISTQPVWSHLWQQFIIILLKYNLQFCEENFKMCFFSQFRPSWRRKGTTLVPIVKITKTVYRENSEVLRTPRGKNNVFREQQFIDWLLKCTIVYRGIRFRIPPSHLSLERKLITAEQWFDSPLFQLKSDSTFAAIYVLICQRFRFSRTSIAFGHYRFFFKQNLFSFFF